MRLRLSAALCCVLLSCKGDASKADDAKPESAKTEQSDPKPDTKTEAKAEAKEEPKAADTGAEAASESGTDTGEPADTGEEEAVDPALPIPPEPGKDGPAYLAVRDRGITRLEAGAFTAVENSPKRSVRDIHLEADGKPYLLAPDGIMRLDGGTAVMIAETTFDTTGTVDAFGMTKDAKTIWAAGYKGVSRWDGDTWTTEPKKVLGDDVTLIKGLAVDASDRVWIASSNKLHTREDDKWIDVDVSGLFERKPFFDAVRRSPDGVAYVIANATLLAARSPQMLEAVDLDLDGFASLFHLSFSDNGYVALRSTTVDVMLVNTRRTWRATKDFSSQHVLALAVDGRGRVWVGSDTSVAVLGPGDEKTEWMSGSVPELVGPVESILVLGAGPKLPEVGEVQTGGLKGQVMVQGKAAAGIAVELCTSPSMMFETSPCADAPKRFEATTDADGRFEVTDVPLGVYGVAVQTDGKWKVTRPTGSAATMKADAVLDLGQVLIGSP